MDRTTIKRMNVKKRLRFRMKPEPFSIVPF